MDASLAKAKSKLKHWEREAKSSAKNIEHTKKERDEAKQEAKRARLTAVAAAATEEDRRRLEDEVACLAIERTSLLLELETSKDEVSSLHSQAGKDKEAIKEDYQKALELIFTYGYG